MTGIRRVQTPQRSRDERGGLGRELRGGKDRTARRLDRGAGVGLQPGARRPGKSAAASRLQKHRVRAPDSSGASRRGRARRTLVRAWTRPSAAYTSSAEKPGVKSLRKGQRLNNVEKIKQERHPLEVRGAIIDTYSKEGLESLQAVHGEMERLKWVGVYPQKQGGNAFMMRYKVPGGVLKAGAGTGVGRGR